MKEKEKEKEKGDLGSRTRVESFLPREHEVCFSLPYDAQRYKPSE